MKKFVITLCLMLSAISAYTQTFSYSFTNIPTYKMSVRANYRIYINGDYSGLVSREYRSILDVKKISDDVFGINGQTYSLSQLIQNGKIVGFKVDDISATDFWLYDDGIMSVGGDKVPFMRNVPVFKRGTLSEDEVYASIGSYVPTIEINGKQSKYVLPVTVSMRYNGTAQIFGKKCDLFESSMSLSAANNYKDLLDITGKHNLRIYFDNNMGMPVYIEDNFSDSFVIGDESGNKTRIRQEGFYLYFYEPYRRLRIHLTAENVKQLLDEDPSLNNDIEIREDPDGLTLVLRNLHFSADSAKIMDSDYKIIFALAQILSKNSDKMVLITGHTAAAGTEEEQIKLSFDRAQAVADALADQRVPTKQLMIDGKGASEPIAPNDTPENMAKNRRVEIKIIGK